MTIRPQNQSARVGDGLAFAGRPGKAVDSAYTPGQRTRVVFWGTYDTGKPRTRILLRGLQEAGVEVIECHVPLWSGVEDKSQLSGWWSRLRYILMWLISYPILIARYLRLPAHDADIIGYMGQLDVLVMWPFARLRGVPIVWDALMSLYIAIVVDRQLLSPRSPLARLLYAWEWVGTRAADLIILNHQVVVDYWAELFGLPAEKFKTAHIGAEIDAFPARKPGEGDDVAIVAFGRMVNLANEAADQLAAEGISCTVVDPRTTSPLDVETIFEAVEETGRLVIVDEAHPRCGLATDIAGQVAEGAFGALKAPIKTVTAPHTPVPFAPSLEDLFVPSTERIIAAVRAVLDAG